MKVFISSNNEEFNINESGVMSMAYWESQDIQVAMNLIFRVRPGEKIYSIIINKDGIKAKFIREASQIDKDPVENHAKYLMEEIPIQKKNPFPGETYVKQVINYSETINEGLKVYPSKAEQIVKDAGEIPTEQKIADAAGKVINEEEKGKRLVKRIG